MSRGRKSFPLAGLQAAYEQGRQPAVAAELLGTTVDRIRVGRTFRNVTEEACEVTDLGQVMARPADYHLRTTRADLRREVREAVRTRRPEWAVWVPFVLGGREDLPDGVAEPTSLVVTGIQLLADEEWRKIRATLPPVRPQSRKARRKPVVMPARTMAPPSGVVLRDRDGQHYTSLGTPITRFEAALLLAPVVVQADPEE